MAISWTVAQKHSVGSGLLPGMMGELGFPLPSGTCVPDAPLFLVWGGANDFGARQPASVAVANIDQIVATLQAEGAQHILVPGLDLSVAPQFLERSSGYAVQRGFQHGFTDHSPFRCHLL